MKPLERAPQGQGKGKGQRLKQSILKAETKHFEAISKAKGANVKRVDFGVFPWGPVPEAETEHFEPELKHFETISKAQGAKS